jgi:hypothetical protein
MQLPLLALFTAALRQALEFLLGSLMVVQGEAEEL